MESRIMAVWSNPTFPYAFSSIAPFYAALKKLKEFKDVSYGEVKRALEGNPDYIYQPGIWRNHYATRKLNFDEPVFNKEQSTFENNPITGVGIEFQADLFEMDMDLKKVYILLVVDDFNNYLYAKALSNKSGKSVAEALWDVKQENNLVKFSQLTTDKGTEFTGAVKILKSQKNWHFKHFIITKSLHKAFLAERYGLLVKERLSHFMRSYKVKKWVEILQQIIKNLNNSATKALGGNIAPAEVNSPIYDPFVRQIRQTISKDAYNKRHLIKKVFNVGDYCFADTPHETFTKSYATKRGQIYQIYKIDDIQQPYKYYLEDLLGSKLQRFYYAWQLKKFPGDITEYNFPIDKILGSKFVNGEKMYKIRYKFNHSKFLNFSFIFTLGGFTSQIQSLIVGNRLQKLTNIGMKSKKNIPK